MSCPRRTGRSWPGMHDAVSVTVNHRLNLLGFLDVSEIGGPAYEDSVNVGMTDLVASRSGSAKTSPTSAAIRTP